MELSEYNLLLKETKFCINQFIQLYKRNVDFNSLYTLYGIYYDIVENEKSKFYHLSNSSATNYFYSKISNLPKIINVIHEFAYDFDSATPTNDTVDHSVENRADLMLKSLCFNTLANDTPEYFIYNQTDNKNLSVGLLIKIGNDCFIKSLTQSFNNMKYRLSKNIRELLQFIETDFLEEEDFLDVVDTEPSKEFLKQKNAMLSDINNLEEKFDSLSNTNSLIEWDRFKFCVNV